MWLQQAAHAQHPVSQPVDAGSSALTTAQEVLAAATNDLAKKPTVYRGLQRHLARLEATHSLPANTETWADLLLEYGGFISMSQAEPLWKFVQKGGDMGLLLFLVVDHEVDEGFQQHDGVSNGCFSKNILERGWWPVLNSDVAAASPAVTASTAAHFYVHWLQSQEGAIRRSLHAVDTGYCAHVQAKFSTVLAAARKHL